MIEDPMVKKDESVERMAQYLSDQSRGMVSIDEYYYIAADDFYTMLMKYYKMMENI